MIAEATIAGTQGVTEIKVDTVPRLMGITALTPEPHTQVKKRTRREWWRRAWGRGREGEAEPLNTNCEVTVWEGSRPGTDCF